MACEPHTQQTHVKHQFTIGRSIRVDVMVRRVKWRLSTFPPMKHLLPYFTLLMAV